VSPKQKWLSMRLRPVFIGVLSCFCPVCLGLCWGISVEPSPESNYAQCTPESWPLPAACYAWLRFMLRLTPQ
jgi:hypothetical protein